MLCATAKLVELAWRTCRESTAALLPLFITNTPAHMLICDTMNSALAAF